MSNVSPDEIEMVLEAKRQLLLLMQEWVNSHVSVGLSALTAVFLQEGIHLSRTINGVDLTKHTIATVMEDEL